MGASARWYGGAGKAGRLAARIMVAGRLSVVLLLPRFTTGALPKMVRGIFHVHVHVPDELHPLALALLLLLFAFCHGENKALEKILNPFIQICENGQRKRKNRPGVAHNHAANGGKSLDFRP